MKEDSLRGRKASPTSDYSKEVRYQKEFREVAIVSTSQDTYHSIFQV
jgi:hypothetical protein